MASLPSQSPSPAQATTPALGTELGKAEARQGKNLWVTSRAIDGLLDRIARAKRELDDVHSASAGTGASASSPHLRTSTKSPSKSSPPSSSSSKSPSKSPSTRSSLKGKSKGAGEGEAKEKGESEGRESGQRTDAVGVSGGGASAAVLAELSKDVEGMRPLETVGSEHKNFHATISKLAKAADKQFGCDVESVRRTPSLNEKALHTAIITHLYRRGAFRAAARFAEESSAAIPPDTSAQLVEMHGVLDALSKQNLAPAERWFEKRRGALEGVGSSLEFQLARLRFLCFLKGADPQSRKEAVLFARGRFPPLAEAHMGQIQELMGSLLWAGRMEDSPYSHLLSVDLWAQARETIVVDGSRLSGLSREGVLAVAFRAGVLALPTLVKMSAVVRGSNQEWEGMQELPLEVPLPQGLRYHSMFSCPVSREPSTPGDPPVLLKCGHAVLRSSVSRLVRNGSKFKCPTCPMEQMESDTLALTL